MRKIPVIFDVDTGIDDALSLFYAAQSDKLDILGVMASHGNTSLENTLRNTLNVLKLCGREDIPVGEGADKPLVAKQVMAENIHGSDGLGDLPFPFADATKALSKKKAWDLCYELIMKSEEKVVLVFLGPMTDGAILFEKYPEVKERIECIVNMGGFLRGGTFSANSSVNIFYDPHGAKAVIESGIPFYMCGGDLTGQAYYTPEELKVFTGLHSPVGQAVGHLMDKYYETCKGLSSNGLCLHDPAATVFLTNPEFFTYGRYYCQVEVESELCLAMTVVDYEDILKKPDAEKTLYFVDTIDRQAFVKAFTKGIMRYEEGAVK